MVCDKSGLFKGGCDQGGLFRWCVIRVGFQGGV